ncbi:GDYXXLXY domain-containing protein [Mesorhizobium xinjiangense]|uniref:GDYXXLXY domain-containing protein n=1 Tax=Mesorhizobium xinjiangense TaxID=2678685 RepID=UPI0012ED65B5|nr:GDYXXLXY domain-containing protein [Mesorhizobium xinjiangense]
MSRRARLIAGAVLVALVQIGFLAWIIAGRAAILRDGAEIRLTVEPVDPRDLLRGDYVRLTYNISTVQSALFDSGVLADHRGAGGERLCIGLDPDEDGIARAVSIRPANDAGRAAETGAVEICGKATGVWSGAQGRNLRLEYGIERFYLPEGEGRAIERDLGLRAFTVVVAVGADGQAQIKALYDGETKLYEEPLY